MPIIDLVRVSKCFHLYPDRPRSLQEVALQALRRPRWHRNGETLWALRDVSFGVEPGQTVGIIGSNGSGKSTCLKLLTRIIQPTSGQVRVQGRVAALLELGAGFHPELTGRENIFLQGAVQGMSRREMVARLDEIVAFAELERFIDVPVKVYSSGMYVRLAFATAIHVQPDVLLVDEVLAVGDQSFQHKCM
ncbi:MAG: ABC transporter ATP-binding protein, partial [Chloroflexota bacterium]